VADINWTEQEIDRLKALVSEGKTNKEIASILSSEYGREFSKISVKSKRQRLNKVTPPRTIDGQSINENKRYNIDGTISQAEFDVKMAFYQKDSKTPEDILKYKGYDPQEWEDHNSGYPEMESAIEVCGEAKA